MANIVPNAFKTGLLKEFIILIHLVMEATRLSVLYIQAFQATVQRQLCIKQVMKLVLLVHLTQQVETI